MLSFRCSFGKDPYFIFKSQRVTLGDSDSLSSASRRSSRRKTEKNPSYPGVGREVYWSNENSLVMCCILPSHTRDYIGIIGDTTVVEGLYRDR